MLFIPTCVFYVHIGFFPSLFLLFLLSDLAVTSPSLSLSLPPLFLLVHLHFLFHCSPLFSPLNHRPSPTLPHTLPLLSLTTGGGVCIKTPQQNKGGKKINSPLSSLCIQRSEGYRPVRQLMQPSTGTQSASVTNKVYSRAMERRTRCFHLYPGDDNDPLGMDLPVPPIETLDIQGDKAIIF